MVQVKRKINGTAWTIKVVTAKQMKKIQDADTAPAGGLCVSVDKTIYLDEDCVNFTTMAHELFHAYVSDLHLDDTNNIPLTDVEEIFAGLFSIKGEKILRQAKNIVKDLTKLMEE